MLRWLVLPMTVFAYLAATVSASTPGDRDHDHLPDRWERNHHLSATTPSAKRDPDGDRLNNRRELRLRTHPRRADTDRDRLRDGAEVRRFHTTRASGTPTATGSTTGASCIGNEPAQAPKPPEASMLEAAKDAADETGSRGAEPDRGHGLPPGVPRRLRHAQSRGVGRPHLV